MNIVDVAATSVAAMWASAPFEITRGERPSWPPMAANFLTAGERDWVP
jgi:hypothetical protein